MIESNTFCSFYHKTTEHHFAARKKHIENTGVCVLQFFLGHQDFGFMYRKKVYFDAP